MAGVDDSTIAGRPPIDRERSLYGDELSPGAQAGEYVIQGTVAAGGCGTVYFAQHRILGRRVAVKVLHREMAASPEMLERFVREARAVNVIKHPNIIDIFEFGTLPDGRPYYVMELLEGTNLGALVQRQGRFSPQEALEVLEPVCAALGAAHERGIIHRDLKASNIAISKSGESRIVKLLDFGIAKLTQLEAGEAELTSAGRRMGTPFAMAPEQIRCTKVDARTDIYALGVLLFHLLTGQYPFQSVDSIEVERLHLEAPPPRPSQFAPVPPVVDAVVLRCLEKDAERRFQSTAAFVEALREAAGMQRPRRSMSANAVAIYVEARMSEEAQAEMDDALLDDLGAVLDMTEQALRGAGFLLPLQTGSALLGARLAPDDPGEERGERMRALELAASLRAQLAQRDRADARIHINTCVHIDSAAVRMTAQGPEIVGGNIVRIGAWVPQDDVAGLCATPQMVDGLGVSAQKLDGKPYVMVTPPVPA